MGQTAYRAKTGEVVEAFSVADAEWEALCSAPRGAILMPHSDWPAVPKTSIRGLRFFAHQPGFTGALPKPESYAHTRLKIDIVKAARFLDYDANVEIGGNTPDGEAWKADALVTLPTGKKWAFEVQLSSQHLDDFRLRTERYRRSSVECCWINSESPVGNRLAKALCHENINFYRTHGQFQADAEDLICLGVQLQNKDSYPEELPLLRFGRGAERRRMPISEAIDGIIKGFAHWRRPIWRWGGIRID
jgi:hypothetical protein